MMRKYINLLTLISHFHDIHIPSQKYIYPIQEIYISVVLRYISSVCKDIYFPELKYISSGGVIWSLDFGWIY